MALLHKFTSKQAKGIEAAYKLTSDKRVADRLYILVLRANGRALEDIARQTKISQPTISRLINKYTKIGLEALVKDLTEQKPIIKKTVTAEQISELKTAFANATNSRNRCRLQVLLLRAKGLSVKETSDLTGYSQTHVTYLEKNYLNNGLQDIFIRKKNQTKISGDKAPIYRSSKSRN